MGGSNKTTTESNPWGPAQDILKKILMDAEKLYDAQGGLNGNWVDREIADLTPEMQQAVKDMLNNDGMKQMVSGMQDTIKQGTSGIGQATGVLGGLTQQGISGKDINKLAGELYDSETVKNQKDSLKKTVQEGLDENIQGINQAAGGSGGMGSSRAGVAEGVAIGEASDALARGTADIENAARTQAYGQALGTLQGNQNTALGAGSALGNLGVSSGNLGLGVSNIYNQMLQNQMTGAGILQGQANNQANNNWFNQQGSSQAGWNNLNNLLGFAGSIGGMGGTTTSKGGGGGMAGLGSLMSGVGAIGGAFFGGPAGAAAGASAGKQFSDTSMKKKIKRKEGKRTKNGAAMYDWEWNDSAKKVAGKKGKGEGVLAQQIAKSNPDAVSKDRKTGRLMVDYDKA